MELIGEYEGSGYKETPYLARRPDGQIVQLTELLYSVARHSDGTSAPAEIASQVARDVNREVSADNIVYLLDHKLRPLGIVAGADGSEPQVEKPDPLLALKLRTTIMPEGLVNFFAGLLRPLFWPPVMVAVCAGFVAFDVWYFGTHGVAQGLRGAIYNPLLILLIYGLLIVSVAWHELGHATACRYGGARPGAIGFGIYIMWPAFYTNVTEIYRLGKGARVRTDLGGMYFNVIFALGTAGVYFATGFEPLLIVVLMQHLLLLYQFMPFLRMDGYYVIADLTGVPDLFPRIKPVLNSLVPGREATKPVTELKPRVRFVVTTWVLIALPLLLFLFLMMTISAPRLLATSWDSGGDQWDRLSAALADDRWATVATSGLRILLLALPVLGIALTLARVTKRAGGGVWNATEDRPLVRTGALALGTGCLAVAAFTLLPNGEYRPIEPGERWTVGDGAAAVAQVPSGAPGVSYDEKMNSEGPERPSQGTEPEPSPPPEEEDSSGGAPAPSPAPTTSEPVESSPTPSSSPSPEGSATPSPIETTG